MKKKFYVTTAIDYVNDKPHIGHSYQKVLADVLARWHKQAGADVFFLTGTDEHGQKVDDAAKAAKAPTKKYVDKLHKAFKKAWLALNLKYDRFIRTTDKDHEAATRKFIKKLYDKGDIYLGKYEGDYCQSCEAYISERDQVDDHCPFHPNKPLKKLSEECYFFRLSKYQDALLDLYEQRKRFVLPKSRFNETKKRVEAGLKDLAISRTSFSWGIPFPLGKKHITYVWFEALLNYITGIGWNKDLKKFNKYWPADVHVLGKDNTWFHAVIWPAMLLAADIEPPKMIYSHSWLNLKGQKMSKSLGNVIDPIYIAKKYCVDAYRYYFMRELTPREDNYYSEEALVEKYNTELANELGNLVSRTIAMIVKYNGGKIPAGKIDAKLKTLTEKVYATSSKHIENCDVDRAVGELWKLVRETNKYIQHNKPWELAKKNKTKLNTILFNCANAIKNICALAWPYIPDSIEKITKQLGLKIEPTHADINKTIKQVKVKRGAPVFPKLEYKAPEIKFSGKKVKIDIVIKKKLAKGELSTAFAEFKGMSVQRRSGELERLKAKTIKSYNKTASLKTTKAYEYLENRDRGAAKVSTEGLHGYVKKAGKLPNINTAVDAYNLISLKTGVIMGLYDCKHISGDVVVKEANGKEFFVPVGKKVREKIHKGEYVIADSKDHVITKWLTKQSEESKIDFGTQNAVLCVQGNKSISQKRLNAILKEVSEFIIKFCGGKYKILYDGK